ncbi:MULTISPECIES: ABC transporter ATP-binding protein [Priestia]|uniref:ABC transporter ATP-binding protein n=1 Tax=Priestia TaxID=2800373 RepID=UPI001E578B1B|nr:MULTISPECIES: ABC transporter ATP-binding protein [Priestia]MCE4093090.1 ABC transporter ATP-binding protein [Priestia megaterium]MED3821532.1 ABC transporter ATP-binding protein [Priestia aryabhattai]
MEEIIKTVNLTKKYKNHYPVQHLNMSVGKGEIYGFLGPNGAGKTTTIRMLLGLIKPSEGDFYIFGKDFKKNRLDILRNVGSLVEYPSYYGQLTGHENLEAIRRIVNAPSNRITEVLKIVRLTDAANRLVKEYSLGMKQRLGIAAALLQNPKLLILDEPTNGLDPAGIHEIRELIKELAHKYEMTILISSHLLSEVDQLASQVGIIVKGKLIYQNSIQNLHKKSSPTFKIGLDNPKNAARFLQQKGWNTTIESGYLYIQETKLDVISKINKELVYGGFLVHCLQENKKSLEDIYLSLTNMGDSL